MHAFVSYVNLPDVFNLELKKTANREHRTIPSDLPQLSNFPTFDGIRYPADSAALRATTCS